MTFHPGLKSHTFHPSPTMAHTFHPGSTMAESTEPDPLKRTAVPFDDEDDQEPRQPSDEDINSMTFGPGTNLRALQRAGIVHPDMTQHEFDARLKRVKMDVNDRVR